MPPMIVRKTIGPISTRNNAMNPVPIGSIAFPKPGASQPTRMPAMIATITQKYSWRYHLGFATGSALAIRSTAVVLAIIPTSLSGACAEGPPGVIDMSGRTECARSAGPAVEPPARWLPYALTSRTGSQQCQEARGHCWPPTDELRLGQPSRGSALCVLKAQVVDDRRDDPVGGGGAADVPGEHARTGRGVDGLLQARGLVGQAEVLQH